MEKARVRLKRQLKEEWSNNFQMYDLTASAFLKYISVYMLYEYV